MNSFAPNLIARVWPAGSIEPLNTTTGISRRLHRFKSSTPPNSNTPMSAMTRFGMNRAPDHLATAPEQSFAAMILIGPEPYTVICSMSLASEHYPREELPGVWASASIVGEIPSRESQRSTSPTPQQSRNLTEKRFFPLVWQQP